MDAGFDVFVLLVVSIGGRIHSKYRILFSVLPLKLK